MHGSDMSPSLLLRIAAVLTLLYCAGHTMGMPWTPSVRPQDIAVLDAMKSDRFEVLGSTRSYWDFYIGFGISISVYLALQAIVLWQLAPLAKEAGARVRPIIGVFLAGFVANALVVWLYFFWVPLVFAIAIATTLAWALVSTMATPAG